VNVADLLHLDKVGDISVLVDTSFHVSCSCVSSGTSRYEHKCAIFSLALEIILANIPENDWHDPALLEHNPIKVFDEIMVPQEMRLEGLMLLEPFFLETSFLYE